MAEDHIAEIGRTFECAVEGLNRVQPFMMAEANAQQWFASYDALTIFGPRALKALAAENASLLARVKVLEEALEPFGRAATYYVHPDEHDMDPIHKMGRASRTIEVGDLRRALTAVTNPKEPA